MVFPDSTDQNISDKQWDDFVDFVNKKLEDHPIAQADTVLALKFGASIYSHYDKWQIQPINIAKPLPAKVCYLLGHWKHINNHTSMTAMVMDLDEKLKSEASFNLMRQQLKQQFL